jgi:hypothetical protein
MANDTKFNRTYVFIEQLIKSTGMDQVFNQDHDWSEVEDPEFHKLRKYYVHNSRLLKDCIERKSKRWNQKENIKS